MNVYSVKRTGSKRKAITNNFRAVKSRVFNTTQRQVDATIIAAAAAAVCKRNTTNENSKPISKNFQTFPKLRPST